MRLSIPSGPSTFGIGPGRPYADLNSVFHSFFNDLSTPRGPRQADFRANLSVQDDAFLLKAELPGVKREAIELSVLDDVLTLSGSFGSTESDEAECGSTCELRSGPFRREFRLAGPVDVAAVSATHVDGILNVRLPKAASAMAQRIEVQGEG